MRMPVVLLVPAFVASCACGTLDTVDPIIGDVPDDVVMLDAAVADGPAPDAPALDVRSVDAPALDVARVDAAPPVDLAPVDAPQPVDVPAADVPSELTDAPLVLDAGVDVPVVPTDTGWGPGPTGYRVVRDDPAARWVDSCAEPGHQVVLRDVDDGSFAATLPFRFRYWGTPIEAGAPVLVSPNGYVTFQVGAPTPANGIIPNRLDGVHAVIAAQWRDLRTRAPGVCIAVLGNPGARRWVVQWSDARYYTSIFGHLNFELVLHETSDAIDLVYDGMTLPEPATVALESWDGARSSVPFVVPQPIVYSRTRARFIPQ
ncbi:MAG: hypothetical protein Q8S73_14280 [Deltaproteobacteria bacterium]|nr:hypothetical protein [Myxococcales bacterium]MDP3215270.1 hypothetical protein [Deltaproteobacteria bacterium]